MCAKKLLLDLFTVDVQENKNSQVFFASDIAEGSVSIYDGIVRAERRKQSQCVKCETAAISLRQRSALIDASMTTERKKWRMSTHHLLIVYSFGIKLDSFFILLFLEVLVSLFLHFFTFLVEGDHK